MDRAHGMTIGHNGNLFVSNLQNSLVQEFNGKTGAFVKTFLDVKRLGGGSVKDLHFESRVGHYFLTSGDIVYELSTEGALLAKHQSNALAGALGMAVAGPHSPPAVAAPEVKLKTLEGLIGYATIGKGHVPVALRYQYRQVFPAQGREFAGCFRFGYRGHVRQAAFQRVRQNQRGSDAI